MAVDDRLTHFVREALSSGRSRDEIRAALAEAGWSKHEAADALGAFATTDFMPPVPRPRAHLTARDTFIYLLLFASLAAVASYLITLIHAILTMALPEPGDYEWAAQAATDSIRWSISTLAVATPVYVWMTRITRRDLSEDAGRRRSPVRKWLTYLALFVSALTFLGDAVYVLYSFLTGETTLRFLLKALTVACVTAAIFAFYLHDIEDGTGER